MNTYYILEWFQKKDLGTKTKLSTDHPIAFNRDGLPTYGPSNLPVKPNDHFKAVPTS